MAITVLLADDEYLARASLQAALGDCCDWQVVAQCERGDQVMDAVRSRAPQVVFMDINMPGLDGLKASKALGELDEPPVLVFVTAYDSACH